VVRQRVCVDLCFCLWDPLHTMPSRLELEVCVQSVCVLTRNDAADMSGKTQSGSRHASTWHTSNTSVSRP
jgi:hypothetical protein